MSQLTAEKYLSEGVMSVHLKEGVRPQMKKGAPGNWILVTNDTDEVLLRKDLDDIVEELEAEIATYTDCFFEQQTAYTKVLQVRDLRTVVTYPPLSSSMEITIVRPVKRLDLEDYDLDESLRDRLLRKAEGVLIAGAPGNGKTTFAQALLSLYYNNQKIIKTIEVPRDLHVPDGVTQYALSHADTDTIRDLLLLTRPDYTFFDEIRNPEDFRLFKDLRLTGIGMVGVIHAERAIDAIQRLIGKIELGMITNVVDTVVYIDRGEVDSVYTLKYAVRAPLGMEDDLARPVISVRDFATGKELYEIYTFGDHVVVIDIEEAEQQQGSSILLEQGVDGVKRKLMSELMHPFEVKAKGARSIEVVVDEKDMPSFIGKAGTNIQRLEKELGLHIDVKKSDKMVDVTHLPKVAYEVQQSRKGRVEVVPLEPFEQGYIYVDKRRQFEVALSKHGTIKIQKGMLTSVVQRGNFILYKLK